MTTMTASQIADLHARRSAKGDGYAPTLAECLDAARAGRLFDVDTQNAGHDGLTIADDAETALAEWAAATVGPVDGEGDAARFARWTAERVALGVSPAERAVCEWSDSARWAEHDRDREFVGALSQEHGRAEVLAAVDLIGGEVARRVRDALA